MTEQQDVLDPRRSSRRRIPVILLGILPAAIAATLLVAGPHYVEPIDAGTSASGADDFAPAALVTSGVIAPKTSVNLAGTTQQIMVTLPKAKTSMHIAKATVKKAPVKTTTTVKKTVKKTVRTSSGSYKRFCANPSNPVSTSGSTGKALLSAVNRERAKLGIGSMSWSSSMAGTATSWSRHMVAVDEKTSKLIDGLGHNPNRPGAENVAVVYSSGGYSAGTAINKMHKNLVYSEGHCLNLMNPNYSSMGAGVASSDDGNTWYATENFR